MKKDKTLHIKDDNGEVIEIKESDSYPKDKNGYYMVCLGKYSYFRGKETKDPITKNEKDFIGFN